MNQQTPTKNSAPLRKQKPGRPKDTAWNDQFEKFCEGREQGMSQTAAARHAGYRYPAKAGARLMKKPMIKKRLAQYEKMRKKATQNALNKQALAAVLTRRELELCFTDILKNGKSESARVSAGMAIARINDWIVRNSDNITDRLKEKSTDELEFIAIHGRDPANANELLAFTQSRNKENDTGPQVH